MMRTLTALSVLAMAAALSAPASAETSLRVDLAGKTTAQAFEAITGAARSVCRGAVAGDAHGLYSSETCVRDTVLVAVETTGNAALTHYARTHGADIVLAAN